MRKIQFYICGSLVLGALLGGCTLPDGSNNNKSPVVVVPTPVTTPSVIVTPVPQIVANPGLIQSTNPNERLKQLKISNKDPFAANPPTALIISTAPTKDSNGNSDQEGTTPDLSEILDGSNNDSGSKNSKGRVVRAKSGKDSANKTQDNSKKTSKTTSKANKSTKDTKTKASKTGKSGSSKAISGNQGKKSGNSGKTGSGNSGKTNNNNTRPSVPTFPNDNQNTPPIAINPGGVPGVPPGTPPGSTPDGSSIPDTPSSLQLASQIEVRGLVQLDNGSSYAIVKAPNSKFTSSVSTGDKIDSKGNVNPDTSNEILVSVKQIDILQDKEGRMSGMVVLEENGLEVTRPVGEKVAGAGDGSEPTPGGTTNNYPNNEANPPDHENQNPGTQQFNTPTSQPVPNPPGNITPTPQPLVNPPATIAPTPIQSPGFSPSSPNPPI
ncbi:hypothetical protein [Merismopedia glauca]|uniref:Uncharacterized protein n=1 Tax=Merismopedia glauca CCAP 1448/3 TaxID=1296344 RepID=A0A2T1C9S8_9CYAN|nr:hypothetical protein [Merismopedia glauca]PSB05025.1 hypothetical protein C7B64_01295 [Merismopedia glauca CCAP 1448/3]